MSDDARQVIDPGDKPLVQSTEAMLDYAMIAGAELRNAKFVSLLQLARRALLGQDQHSNTKDGDTAALGE